jgi:glycosyltransferase involved in cell wall biosynthesis
MRVAITHDWLNQYRGGERALTEIHHLFPSAPVYTSVYDRSRMPAEVQEWDIRTSFLQRVPFARRHHQAFLPLMPLAFEQFDMTAYDLVITSSSSCAKGVVTRPGATNICYCYTPTRYLWDLYHEYTREHRGRALIAPIALWLRMWDRLAADRVDHFIAISHEVAKRIQRHYRRESDVVYPPVDVHRIRPNGLDPEGFYLVVSALVGYKRIDLAIAAANRLKRRLVIVGDGPQRSRLAALAGPTVEFHGRPDDDTVADLYARCSAFLFPGLEDFGIAPVEAQAAGRPVIAYGEGGARETVEDGRTGILFPEQTVESLMDAMVDFESRSFDPATCRANAERFDRSVFRRRFLQVVNERVQLPRLETPPLVLTQRASNG